MALALHVTEIDVVTLVCGEEFAEISACRQKRNFAAQECERLPQILDTVYVDLVDHRGFERICSGDEQRAFAAASRLQRDRQHAFHGANGTVKSELTNEAEIFEWRTVEFLRNCDHSKRNR